MVTPPMTVKVIPKKGAAHARWYTIPRLEIGQCSADGTQCLKLWGWDAAGQLKVEVEVSVTELMAAFEKWKSDRDAG